MLRLSIWRSRPLNCPGCGTPVEDGTSICPTCDYIIDDSFLRSDPPAPAAPPPQARAADRTFAQPRRLTPTEEAAVNIPPSAPRAAPARPARRSGVKRPAPSPPPSEPEPWLEQPYEKPPEPDWHVRPKVESGSKHGLYGSSNVTSPTEELANIKDFIANLGSADKLAFTGAALTVLVSFFPWKDTVAEGEVLGLMSLGAVTTLFALLTIAAIIVRVQRLLPRINVMFPWLMQLATTCAAIVWCLVFIKLSWNGTKVHAIEGNTLKPISAPDMGVFLAIVSSILSLGGTLMGLKDKQV